MEAAEVRIDGMLDEPVWSQATRLTGFWQYQPVDGRPAEEETEVLVWYAPDAIYFGIIAHDRSPGRHPRHRGRPRQHRQRRPHRPRPRHLPRPPPGLLLRREPARRRRATGCGARARARCRSLIPGSTDSNPDFTWESKGRITDRGYEVEIRIPFKSLRYPGGEPQSWGFNVTRVVQRTGYTDTWTDVRRANASFLGQEGAIGGLHDLQRGVTVEAQPFVTATANGSRDDRHRRVRPRET